MTDCLEDIFDFGSGFGCPPNSSSFAILRYSYIGGTGAIALLLLLSTVLLVAVCCLAVKLRRARR